MKKSISQKSIIFLIFGMLVGFIVGVFVSKEIFDKRTSSRSLPSEVEANDQKIIKHYDKFNQFAPPEGMKPIYLYAIFHLVSSPSDVASSKDCKTLGDEMRYAGDILDQAALSFSYTCDEIKISNQLAEEIKAGRVDVFKQILDTQTPAAHVFLVKDLPRVDGRSIVGREKFIVLSDDSFDKKGRVIAHEIGHYFGLHHPLNVVDPDKISGLMGNMGYLDIIDKDVETMRSEAQKLSDLLKIR